MLNGCPFELKVNVPSGELSNDVSTPFTVIGDPTGVESEFTYAVSRMGLPVPPEPGSCNSAVLNTKLMLVKFWLKVMSKWSLLIVLGQRKRPENLAEFITVEIAANELRF
jgi:hypothetical protein